MLPLGQPLVVDRYQLIGEIASGGMATVYLARLGGVGGFERFVAIKRLHPHLAKEREFVEMFLDEARLAARIHHQNVVSILEIGTSDAGYYLVMEYVEGATLARLNSDAQSVGKVLPRPVLLRILLDALQGLSAAHDLEDDAGEPLGLVHRDCTPQNLLVGMDGHSKITDFGVARASSRLATTRSGRMKGKLAYMAPEQMDGDELDRRADLFSIATVLWEGLAGQRLFKAPTETQTMAKVLHKPIPRLSAVVGDIHPALDALCHRALDRDPDRRFQTAVEMADALELAAAEAARATGVTAIASVREVAALMQEIYGNVLATQRDSVRSFLAATSSAGGETSVGSTWPTAPGRNRPSAGDDDEPTRLDAPQDDATRVFGVTPLATERPLLAPGSRSRARWLALAAVAFLIGVVLLLVRRPPGEAEPAAARPEPSGGGAVSVATAPAAPPSEPATAVSTGSSSSAAVVPPPRPPLPDIERPPVSPPPVKPPPARPPVLPDDDLSNPYR